MIEDMLKELSTFLCQIPEKVDINIIGAQKNYGRKV